MVRKLSGNAVRTFSVSLPPRVDGAFADAALWREVAGDVSGDFIEGHAVNPGDDECLQDRIGCDDARPAGAVFPAMVRRLGGDCRQGVEALLKGLFKGVFKPCNGAVQSGFCHPHFVKTGREEIGWKAF
jgi:hypothetical protein